MILRDSGNSCTFKDVWVLAEFTGGKVHNVTYELLGAAKKLSDKLLRKSRVVCLVLGEGTGTAAEKFFHYCADVVITVDDASLKTFNDTVYASVISRLVKKYKPEILISGATSRGRSIMPRVAVLVETGLTADCTGLDIEEETGLLLQTRPAYGGNIIATIKCEHHRPQMSTVRQGVFKAPVPDNSGTGEVIEENVLEAEKKTRISVIEESFSEDKGINLSDADIIVTGGRGVKGPKGFNMIAELAKVLKGAVGASRAAVDSGWISYTHQVGQTGRTVQPKIYIACGVSGQIQHLAGMQSSDFIIAVNKDAEAPIMKLADVAIVGDLFEVIPEIIKLLKPGIPLDFKKLKTAAESGK